MKVAIVGSRSLKVSNLEDYIPAECTEIVSGGARGIDTCARFFAKEKNLILTEFLPDYDAFGKGAPLKRNLQIIEYADLILIFWDGVSRGTKFVIEHAKKEGKKYKVFIAKEKK